MWSSRPYTFDRVVRIIFTMIAACILLYFLYILRDVLLPFCVACLIAYIIEPWVKWNQKTLRIKNHTCAVVLTSFEGLSIFAILCIIFIPIVEREFSQLAVLLDHYVKNGHPAISRFPETFHRFIHSSFDIEKLISDIEKINTTAAIEEAWKSITSGLDKILGILGWLISIVYVIFILLDFDKYKNGIKKLIPNKYIPAARTIGHDLSWSMKRYFRNQALISFITGLCYTIGFSIVGIPMAVVIGLTNMVLFMVPYLVYVSLIPVTIMCAFKSMETGMDFWTIWLECMAVYAFVESFSDLILTPHIMGKALGMNPAMILLSLSVWGTLLGLLGMVIALPATTILTKWFKLWLTNWRDKENAKLPSPPPDTGPLT
ncbi:MAG: AI-2E family transporter [Muribaculaceae bacterium]|nr:AI-2E family transporter [Muribaculaceae bacterium]